MGRGKHNSWRIFVIISCQRFHRRENQLKAIAWFHCLANLGRSCRGRLLLLQPDLHVHLQEPLLSPLHPFLESPGWGEEGSRAAREGKPNAGMGKQHQQQVLGCLGHRAVFGGSTLRESS